MLECIQLRVTQEMNDSLCSPFAREEIEKALAQMNPHKASVPEGFNVLFFQKYWTVIGDEVKDAVLSILAGHVIPLGFNHTYTA